MFMCILLFQKIKLLDIKVVYTVHNLTPHESLGKLQMKLEEKFNKLVDVRIYMQPINEVTPHNQYVPHGIYDIADHVSTTKKSEDKNISLLCLGFLRPAKNLENLILQFPDDNSLTLEVAGEPIRTDYGITLVNLSSERENVKVSLGRLSESEMLEKYFASKIAIVPYQNTYNSGAALFALSIPIPLIATTSDSMLRLQAEVGESWMQIVSQNFDSIELSRAIEKIVSDKNSRSDRPTFSKSREWTEIGKAYSKIYRAQSVE
jgi:glycosyltransferase involved in cell wall biosynthesis